MERAVSSSEYFKHRNVGAECYSQYQLPTYLCTRLPENRDAWILDFGCGFGQVVRALIERGYFNVVGYDIEPDAIAYCEANNLPVIDGTQCSLLESGERKYQLIIVNHVLEHIPKVGIVEILDRLRGLLTQDGSLFVSVPNAQSHTGCYWAYEDFTHETLFTSGSLYFVLSKAGYSDIQFVDIDCTEGSPNWKRLVRKGLLSLYRSNYRFWNKVTGSAFHQASPEIFSYEIKAVAKP